MTTVEDTTTVEGTVIQIIDHGTIVQMLLRDDGGRVRPIHFDHRPFRHFYEAEGPFILGETRIAVTVYDDGTEGVEVVG